MDTKKVLKNLVGFVCSSQLDFAYCIKDSYYHNQMKNKGEDIGKIIIYVPKGHLPSIIHKSMTKEGKIKFDIEYILKNKSEKEEIN